MSNHFPASPTGFGVTQIQYITNLGNLSGDLVSGGSGYVTGPEISQALQMDALQLTVTFTTPGGTGSFDQDAFESAYKDSVTGVLQAVGTFSGVPLAALQSQVHVLRLWNLATADLAWSTGIQDEMSYP
jgi:hypothetical protein